MDRGVESEELIHPGTRIARYVVHRLLGRGGFGAVFVAHDERLDRDIALKVLLPEHTGRRDLVQRFLQEARAAAKIIHPGIVTVFDCDTISGTGTELDGSAYIAMELLTGESLAQVLERLGRLSSQHARAIGAQIASALAAAHDAGIVHRDLKPDNVFVTRDPQMTDGERIKILDFGIAKLLDAAGPSVQTQTRAMFGTPGYMAPEQARSTASVDLRADIYALGCMMFELVCGRPPFVGDAGAVLAHHQLVAPPSLLSFTPSLEPRLVELIEAMLRKDPAVRPQTMAEVERQLSAGRHEVPPLRPTEVVHNAGARAPESTTISSASGSVSWRRIDHPGRLIFVAAAVTAALVTIMAVAFWSRGGSEADPASTRGGSVPAATRPEITATPIVDAPEATARSMESTRDATAAPPPTPSGATEAGTGAAVTSPVSTVTTPPRPSPAAPPREHVPRSAAAPPVRHPLPLPTATGPATTPSVTPSPAETGSNSSVAHPIDDHVVNPFPHGHTP